MLAEYTSFSLHNMLLIFITNLLKERLLLGNPFQVLKARFPLIHEMTHGSCSRQISVAVTLNLKFKLAYRQLDVQ